MLQELINEQTPQPISAIKEDFNYFPQAVNPKSQHKRVNIQLSEKMTVEVSDERAKQLFNMSTRLLTPLPKGEDGLSILKGTGKMKRLIRKPVDQAPHWFMNNDPNGIV